jgi:hypothetical protein
MDTKKHFELYISNDILLPEDWQKLYQSLLLHLGIFSKFELTFRCTDNVLRFFISCDKDISTLSNSISGLLLQPISHSEFEIPKTRKKEKIVRFVNGGNLLDLREKIVIKRAKDMQYVTFTIRGINANNSIVHSKFYFKDAHNNWSKNSRAMTLFPSKLLSINFANNTRYSKKSLPKYLNIEKALHMMVREDHDAIFKIDTFPYLSQDYYLNLTNYDFDKHSFIIGASGSGKSKLISLFIDRLSRTALSLNYRVVVIDPHASLANDFIDIPGNKIITFDKNNSINLFPDAETNINSAAELTTSLFKSVLNDQSNPRLDKLLKFSIYTLMTAQIMSLENLKKFLTVTEYRTKIIKHVDAYIPENIVKFFGADFNELRTKNYAETILPIISMIDEMQLQPSLVGENETSLTHTIQENFLTVFSLSKIDMGEKVIKTVAGLLIQQIFLLAQSQIFGQKIILIIDEVSIVQNPTLIQILAEARKFNLTVILTQQYFGQVNKDLRDAIFANVLNYYIFKVSEEDAKALEGNLNIDLPKALIKSEYLKGLKESDITAKIMTELHPRECLVRVASNGQISPCIKARTVDIGGLIRHHKNNSYISHKILPNKFVENSEPIAQSINQPDIQFNKIPAPPAQFSSIYDLITMSTPPKINAKKDKDIK